MVHLSFRQMLELKVFGYAQIFTRTKQGWRHPVPFYVVECKDHGYFIDYAHGYRRYFMCPLCRDRQKREMVAVKKAVG